MESVHVRGEGPHRQSRKGIALQRSKATGFSPPRKALEVIEIGPEARLVMADPARTLRPSRLFLATIAVKRFLARILVILPTDSSGENTLLDTRQTGWRCVMCLWQSCLAVQPAPEDRIRKPCARAIAARESERTDLG